MVCTFILRLPQHIRWLLWASSWMNTMIVEQLMAREETIMTDTEEPEEITAVVQPAHAPTRSQKHKIICYKCSRLDHLFRNCLQEYSEVTNDWSQQSHWTVQCFQCNKNWACCLRVSGKQLRGEVTVSAYSLREMKIEVLPTTDICKLKEMHSFSGHWMYADTGQQIYVLLLEAWRSGCVNSWWKDTDMLRVKPDPVGYKWHRSSTCWGPGQVDVGVQPHTWKWCYKGDRWGYHHASWSSKLCWKKRQLYVQQFLMSQIPVQCSIKCRIVLLSGNGLEIRLLHNKIPE